MNEIETSWKSPWNLRERWSTKRSEDFQNDHLTEGVAKKSTRAARTTIGYVICGAMAIRDQPHPRRLGPCSWTSVRWSRICAACSFLPHTRSSRDEPRGFRWGHQGPLARMCRTVHQNFISAISAASTKTCRLLGRIFTFYNYCIFHATDEFTVNFTRRGRDLLETKFEPDDREGWHDHCHKTERPRILWREVIPVHGYLDHRPAPTRALPLSRSKYDVTQGVSTAEAPAKQIISPERRPCVDLHIQEYFGRMGVKSVKLCLFF